jgi:hypothetical protein
MAANKDQRGAPAVTPAFVRREQTFALAHCHQHLFLLYGNYVSVCGALHIVESATDVDKREKNDGLPQKALSVEVDGEIGRVKLANLRLLAA